MQHVLCTSAGATQYSREDELRLWRVGELLLAKQSDRIITNKPPLAHLVKRGLKKAMQHFFLSASGSCARMAAAKNGLLVKMWTLTRCLVCWWLRLQQKNKKTADAMWKNSLNHSATSANNCRRASAKSRCSRTTAMQTKLLHRDFRNPSTRLDRRQERQSMEFWKLAPVGNHARQQVEARKWARASGRAQGGELYETI